MQHHADHRSPRPLLAMRRAPRRRLDQPGRLQRQPGDRVAELVVVPLRQLLVDMLHREASVPLLVQPQHPQDLLGRRPPARRLADPPITQTLGSLLMQPVTPAPERPLRHTEHLHRLDLAQLASLLPLQQPLEPHLPYPLQHLCPAHLPLPLSSGSKIGQITRYKLRTDDESATIRHRLTWPPWEEKINLARRERVGRRRRDTSERRSKERRPIQ